MDHTSLKVLVNKLNDTCRRSLEAAAGLCLSRTNYNVEIEHWLLKLCEAPDGDLAAIFRRFEIDASRVVRDLTATIDRLKTGNARAPALSPEVVSLMQRAWMAASIEFGAAAIRSGVMLYALLSDDKPGAVGRGVSATLDKISVETLGRELLDITAASCETREEPAAAGPSPAGGGQPGKPMGPTKTPSLDQFTVDLTARARQGKIDPVLGRDAEIRQVIDILTRRRQNNPILTGEAGVGKTAVVEGFAVRIAAGDVPPSLQPVALRTLDLGLLQAGAGIKGEFENRLKSVIEEVKASPQPIILFIDEAHTMIGAGGQAGQGDAANLLKPALARGELRTIAATTWAEYKKYFEKDAALARRFQVVKVEEPDESAAVEMMRGLVETLEQHHGVRILDEAVVDAVRLSHRYISGRQLPDKSVSLLDTACARVAIGHTATPPAVEDARRRIEQLDVALDILGREDRAGADHRRRLDELNEEKTKTEAELAALESRWKEETALVEKIRAIRLQLEADEPADDARSTGFSRNLTAQPPKGGTTSAQPPGHPLAGRGTPAPPPLTDEQRQKLRAELQDLTCQLKRIQGETPLMQVCVDSQAVAAVVAGWTGIPVGRMVTDEIRTVLELQERMEKRIIGQSHALDAIAQRIRTSRANLTDPRRPIGVFMLVGPSGVGKTETAMTLADLLYGGDQNMTVINMSEFKEEHKVSLLMGSPPGYVGYGEGGVLTEAVRRRPYSVVLLDEMEKAHPGVQDIFYQVFDKGSLRDGEGRDIDFKNTLILMTSNAGTDLIMKLCADAETAPDAAGLADALHPELLKTFKPAFLGRVVLVPYFPLGDDTMKRIVELQLGRIRRRVEENHRAKFTYDAEMVTGIASRCTEVDTGARNVDHILTRTLLPEMSAEFLGRMADGQTVQSVHVSMNEDGTFRYQFA